MALIVEYHVNADHYPVGTTAISAGMLVILTSGLVTPAGATALNVIGVAGDSSLDAEGQTTAYSNSVTIGADGAQTRWTSNRVSDFYDETKASNRITVYNGGGKFWVSGGTNSDLISGTIAEGNLVMSGASGVWTAGSTTNAVVGVAVGALQDYPSGVPGTDVDGSITLGSYQPFVLRI